MNIVVYSVTVTVILIILIGSVLLRELYLRWDMMFIGYLQKYPITWKDFKLLRSIDPSHFYCDSRRIIYNKHLELAEVKEDVPLVCFRFYKFTDYLKYCINDFIFRRGNRKWWQMCRRNNAAQRKFVPQIENIIRYYDSNQCLDQLWKKLQNIHDCVFETVGEGK